MKEALEYSRILDEITAGFQHAQILYTALELGVFAHLVHQSSADEVAAQAGIHPRGARMLLDGLVAMNIVRKMDGKYQNGDAVAACLAPGATWDQTHILRHKANCRKNWLNLTESVRKGRSCQHLESERNDDELRSFILGMADTARFSANSMLDALDLSDKHHLLDLGGGPGTYSQCFLQAYPHLHATELDLPPVVQIALDQARSIGVSDRFDVIAGDMTKDEYGTGYDVVLLSNIIHSFGPEMNRHIVLKCFDALVPGGTLIIKDFLVDSGRTGPAFGLIFALHMLVNTEEGDTYTPQEVESWTEAAGFNPGRLLELTPQTRMWLAEKPL